MVTLEIGKEKENIKPTTDNNIMYVEAMKYSQNAKDWGGRGAGFLSLK